MRCLGFRLPGMVAGTPGDQALPLAIPTVVEPEHLTEHWWIAFQYRRVDVVIRLDRPDVLAVAGEMQNHALAGKRPTVHIRRCSSAGASFTLSAADAIGMFP